MGPKTTRGRKPKAADNTSETKEEERKPIRSTRGQSDKDDNSGNKEKPVSKKTKALDVIEQEVKEMSSPEGTDSESSEKPVAKKGGRLAKGKNISEEKQSSNASSTDSESSEKPVAKKGGRLAKGKNVSEEKRSSNASSTDSESSEKPVAKKRGRLAKGKNESEEKQSSNASSAAKEHAVSDDDDSEADTSEPSKSIASPPKKRGRMLAVQSSDEPSNKKSKTENGKGDSKPKLNQTSSNYGNITFDSAAQTKDGKKWNFKISSWNVAGLKAWVKKDGLDFIKHEKPDIICLQETKCSEKKLPPEAKVPGYHTYWLSGEKEGYAGVALLSKEKPIKVDYGIGNKAFDCDGRIITAEFEKFFLVAVYVPNAGQKLKNLDRRMEWDPLLRAHIKKLDEKKPVILCGDMNVSHTEIDLANPKTNTKSAGFTQEERDGLTVLLKEGFIDTFRHLYPEKTGAYTFWTYMGNARSRNTGWRLDYFILSERFVPSVCDNVMRNDIFGSDHCPITLFLHI